ncbi:ATP-binding cassette subfamily F protein 3 [Haloferula luteola]|uniref:ATP-binding cassette subfamily F protein 3 n=1 Tax=Haloferula luteola TaxID=595692 RepID=A0A840VBZ2_9BACT|nr:ABC-F family ATP-binding cassette domain-containing protein [Haloferula luteola]MBB5352188.1 ATP-binding cassette subfamily F protein 3 [Haloferula luteola]
MLSIQNLRVEFGPRILFEDLSFTVQPKERIAFAGHNGAGKSTLMKCVAGVIEATSGKIAHPKGFQIGYLPQEGIHVHGCSLWDETMSAFGEALSLQEKIDRLAAELPKLDPRSSPYAELLEEIGDLELRLEAADPARLKPRAESVLQGLGFKREDFTRDCGEFSGGWQMRIAMAKLFLSEPDILLLDEPTNHLDIESQRWVEQYLHAYPGAILIISHDLSLLDALCTRTIAFHHGRAEEYSGNFSYFLRESVHRKEVHRKRYEAQQREIAETKRFIDRFRASANKASLVQSRIKLLEKIELIPAPEDDDAVMSFRFPQPKPSAHLVARLSAATQRYGPLTVFENFDFEINRGEKLAIVGPNGAGKSTFCRMITGQEEPISGSHEFGGKVATSFFSQTHADTLDPEKTVLETIEEATSREMEGQARNLLGCFLFRGDEVFKKVGVLSGGERSRVALVRMLVQPANFLILDEPTNHLDVQSQEVLQNALRDYEGTVIIVSHNRSFLDPLVSKTLEFRPGHSPRPFAGNISYYLEKTAEESTASTGPSTKPALASSVSASAPSGNRKEQRKQEAELRQKKAKLLKPLESELEQLETRIAELEGAQATLTQALSSDDVAADPDKLRQTANAVQQLTDKLEMAYSRWGELSDQIEKVQAELEA